MDDDTEFVPDFPAFGRFRVTASLGAGAVGAVYRARDDALGRDVAVKVLRATNPVLRERFLREARALGRIPHPNILEIYDVGTEDGVPYLVMELAGGGSLAARLATGRLAAEEVRPLGVQIARALAAAHAEGILHRDVKPSNILATGAGTWKLADFGIAHLPESQLTVPGQFLGSPAYAAPESLLQQRFSAASDVYALGATLFHALTGEPPHGYLNFGAMIARAAGEAPPLAARVDLPPVLAAAVDDAIAIDSALRPSASGLADRLAVPEPARTSASGPPPPSASGPANWLAVQDPGGPRMPPRPHRRLLVGAGLALAAVLVGVFAARPGDDQHQRARGEPASTAVPAPLDASPRNAAHPPRERETPPPPRKHGPPRKPPPPHG